MKDSYRKYSVVMILCFMIGGFSIVLFLLQAYEAFLRPAGIGGFSVRVMNNTTEGRMLSYVGPEGIQNFSFPPRQIERGIVMAAGPAALLSYPFSIVLLINGAVLLLGGVSIWKITREKEIVSVREKLTSMLLLPEERGVLEEMKRSGGEITQSQLVVKTGMSKVKIHRVVKGLETKGIVKKYGYGLTNKIILEKDITEPRKKPKDK